MHDPFDADDYDPSDPFSPSVRGMVHEVVRALADETAAAADDNPYAATQALHPSFNRELGRILYPWTDPDNAEEQSIGEIGDRLKGLRLDDLLGSPVGRVYLRNIGQALEIRNEADDAYTGIVTDSVTAKTVKADTGETIDVKTAAGQLGPREIYISLGTGDRKSVV